MENANQDPEANPALETWLTMASRDLCKESRQRIREEVTDHYEQAVEKDLGEGKPAKEAAERALANLGSPKKANREYKRNHLTAWQKMNIDQFVGLRRSWYLLSLILVIVGYQALTAWQQTGHPLAGATLHWPFWLKMAAAYAFFRWAPLKAVMIIIYTMCLIPFDVIVFFFVKYSIYALTNAVNSSPLLVRKIVYTLLHAMHLTPLGPGEFYLFLLFTLAASVLLVWRVIWPILAKMRRYPEYFPG
jgi:hypothetical protein